MRAAVCSRRLQERTRIRPSCAHEATASPSWNSRPIAKPRACEADGDTALGDLIARETAPGPDEMVLDAEDRARLEAMLSSLDERSQDVVRRRYGLLDGRQAKLADIGVQWGITAERVRQIERQALATLRAGQGLAA